MTTKEKNDYFHYLYLVDSLTPADFRATFSGFVIAAVSSFEPQQLLT